MDNFQKYHSSTTQPLASKGLTLVEILISMGIVLLLLGIALPVLKGARRTARQLSCVAACRSSELLVRQYCNDWKGYFPCTDLAPYRLGPPSGEGWSFLVGGSLQFNPGTWAFLFKDQWQQGNGGLLSPGLRCPGQPPPVASVPSRSPEATPVDWSHIPYPMYYLSSVLASVPGSYSPPTSRPPYQEGFHRIDDVRYPAKKFVLYEASVWCDADSNAEIARSIDGLTSTLPFAYTCADGSSGRVNWAEVQATYRSQGLPPNVVFSTVTPNGVNGKDLP